MIRPGFSQEYFGEFLQTTEKEWEVRRLIIDHKIVTEMFDRRLPHVLEYGFARVLPGYGIASRKFDREHADEMRKLLVDLEVDQKTFVDARSFVEQSIPRHGDRLDELIRLRDSFPSRPEPIRKISKDL